MQRIYINRSVDPRTAHAGLTGAAAPNVSGILGAPLNALVAFVTAGEQGALADDSTGKFTLKAANARTGEALFLDVSMEKIGTGAASTYKFSGVLSSDELIAALAEEESIVCKACVSWTEPETDEDKCIDFDFTVYNSASRPDDSLPANTDARWAWLKEAAPEANGFTHDDEAKTLAVEAGGITEESDPVASAALATHAARTDNPHGTTKAQVGLGNVDNTSDANKPVSTATQTALNLKANLASPALTGTPTAPTPADGTSNTQIATTAFVAAGLTNKLDKSSNLGDLASAATARGNLGLGSVDNTSDANKPISNATQSALNAKEAAQTAVSQAEAEAGTETAIRKWSPLRVKQAIAALATGGGGSPISDPDVAYIRADGDDTTGDGSANAPWKTLQKAVDEGFRVIDAGVGDEADFGGLTFSTGNLTLFIRGCGVTQTKFDQFVFDPAGLFYQLTIHDIGRTSFDLTGGIVARTPGTPGSQGGQVNLFGVHVTGDIQVTGVDGDTEATGGVGGVLVADRGSIVHFVYAGGGGGGAGGESSSSGNGGAGGNAIFFDSVALNNVDVVGGNPGASGGGGTGATGADGSLIVKRATLTSFSGTSAPAVLACCIADVFYANAYP